MEKRAVAHWNLWVLVPVLGLGLISDCGAPDLEPPLRLEGDPFAPMAMPKGDIRHTFPDTWREALSLGANARRGHLAGSQGRLTVTPRVGIGPLAIRVLWHVPSGLTGVATLQATQTDIDPPMVVCTTRRQLQGRAETVEAHWQLPQGLYDVSGCAGRVCVSQAVVVS